MPIFAFLLQGAALGLTAAASPGPLQAYLINRSLAAGWRRAAPVAFAPLISDPPVILAFLLLLGQLPPLFLRGVSLFGGLFVLYLAWGLWQGWRAGAGLEISTPDSSGGLWRAVMINLLGPGLYLFWALVNGPILLDALRQSALDGAAFLFGFYTVMVGGMLCLAALFHQARRLGPRVVRALLFASIVILVGFGVLLLWRSLYA